MDELTKILGLMFGGLILIFISGVLVGTWVPIEQKEYYVEGVLDGKASTNDAEYIRCAAYVSAYEPTPLALYYAKDTAHQDQNRYNYCKGFVDGYAQQHIGKEGIW